MTVTRSRPHTLAQFARRARMSAQRLRKLHGERRLPPPDGVDPDGAEVWTTASIDRWLRATDRAVPDDAVWPFAWPDATEPAEVIWSGDIDLPRGHTAAVTIFDGAGQPVVYAVGYVGQDVSRDTIADAAIARLDPDRRPGAVVVQPFLLDPDSDGPYPHLELWRVPEQPEPAPDPASAALPAMLRRVLPHREPVAAMRQPVIGRQRRPDAPEYAGSVFASEVARVLGRPVPLWWAGTTTPEIMRTVRLLDQPRPLPIPDTITEWPGAIARLTAALDRSVHTAYPQAFALLARETRAAHRDVTTALTHPGTGDGWYLAAAPQPPTWPAVAEQRAAVAAGRDLDPAAALDELDRLAQAEADLPWRPSDPYGDALRQAILLLRGQLVRDYPERVYTFCVTYSWPDAHGPIHDEYRRHLTRLTTADAHGDPDRPTRRLVRLLTEDATDAAIAHHQMLDRARERLVGLYRDPEGRLVAHLTAGVSGVADHLLIEWPTNMPPAGWTEQTVIAADKTYSGTGLFAVTPAPDGTLLAPQPVPNPGDEPRYTFGYDGNSPAVLYQALVRCALGNWKAAAQESWVQQLSARSDDERGRPHSQLWQQITTSQGTLRLSWADVQHWAHDDQQALHRRHRPAYR
ncbi:hypothetical protein ONA91_34215 [Micromonospora sp. DR5-3]|uniref:hypothetical protein n=1 Tax=unclassified Micromonospora TaxID=2617518 RepID=UPI0011D7672D|nr:MULTISPECIES: hypothetical protein [unclassified Micromonospora]MCW3819507.1 hypothetical protein [Micromonospora sp. DR5-3]TYC21877.1 hypothetical protein FXF52_23540 [Micromonospora sp. MP36]